MPGRHLARLDALEHAAKLRHVQVHAGRRAELLDGLQTLGGGVAALPGRVRVLVERMKRLTTEPVVLYLRLDEIIDHTKGAPVHPVRREAGVGIRRHAVQRIILALQHQIPDHDGQVKLADNRRGPADVVLGMLLGEGFQLLLVILAVHASRHHLPADHDAGHIDPLERGIPAFPHDHAGKLPSRQLVGVCPHEHHANCRHHARWAGVGVFYMLCPVRGHGAHRLVGLAGVVCIQLRPGHEPLAEDELAVVDVIRGVSRVFVDGEGVGCLYQQFAGDGIAVVDLIDSHPALAGDNTVAERV